MTERFVSVAAVTHRALAQPLLDLPVDHGIRAWVNSDDCGGVDPALNFVNGTHVMVPDVDRVRAEELVALADTIKILNDDDALDLFKKTLPSASSSPTGRSMSSR